MIDPISLLNWFKNDAKAELNGTPGSLSHFFESFPKRENVKLSASAVKSLSAFSKSFLNDEEMLRAIYSKVQKIEEQIESATPHEELTNELLNLQAEVMRIKLDFVSAFIESYCPRKSRDQYYKQASNLILPLIKADTTSHRIFSPLCQALKSSQFETTQLFLKMGTSFDSMGNTALHRAISHALPDLAKILIENGANLNKRNDLGYTPLHLAVLKNDLEAVKFLIQRGADIHIRNQQGLTPLELAIIKQRNQVADLIANEQSYMEEIEHNLAGVLGRCQLPVNTPFADTDLILFPDDYQGLLPLNGIKKSQFFGIGNPRHGGLLQLYEDICQNRTKFVFAEDNLFQEEVKKAFKKLLTREVSRRVIDLLIQSDSWKTIHLMPGEENKANVRPNTDKIDVSLDLDDCISDEQIYEYTRLPNGELSFIEPHFYITLAHELIHLLEKDIEALVRRQPTSPAYDNAAEEKVIRGTETLSSFSEVTQDEVNKFMRQEGVKGFAEAYEPEGYQISENDVRSAFGLPYREGHHGKKLPKEYFREPPQLPPEREVPLTIANYFVNLILQDMGLKVVEFLQKNRDFAEKELKNFPFIDFTLRAIAAYDSVLVFKQLLKFDYLNLWGVDYNLLCPLLTRAKSGKVLDLLLSQPEIEGRNFGGPNDEQENTLLHLLCMERSGFAREDPFRFPIDGGDELELMDSPAIFRILLKHGIDVNAKNVDAETALHIAAKQDNDQMIGLLLENGADRDVEDHLGQTPFYIACLKGNLRSVQMLLKLGANPEIMPKGAKHPLFHAIANHPNLVRTLLLSSSIRKDILNENQQTALHAVVLSQKLSLHGKFALVEELLELGISPNIRDSEGKTYRELFEKEICEWITKTKTPLSLANNWMKYLEQLP